MKKPKVLFILKKRQDYGEPHPAHIGLSTGLYNSATFVNDMLNDAGIHSHIEVVVDNNDIDREVTKHKPTHVIIEALWVVPSKFDVLCKLHPTVNWIIRLHSELPFLANEGNAMDWIGCYIQHRNVHIAVNAPRTMNDIKHYLRIKMGWLNNMVNKKVIYLPNFYPQKYKVKKFNVNDDTIDISCFGAVRPFKNHLNQAMAAIKFADKIGKKLRFHINTGRFEMKGVSVYTNLVGLFDHLSDRGHKLINHEWTHHDEFLKICSQMDIAMQCSFSETFNIVAADEISQGVPLVASKEIVWSSSLFNANPTDTKSITNALMLTYKMPCLNVKWNKLGLTTYTNKTRKIWVDYFKKQNPFILNK